MNHRMIAVMLASAWLLAGCSRHYYQEGKTIEQCRQSYKECAAKFKKIQDPNAPEELGRYNVSYNYEGKFMDTCMREKGYQIVAENKLPLDVRREKPDPWTPPWPWTRSQRGLAGTLVE